MQFISTLLDLIDNKSYIIFKRYGFPLNQYFSSKYIPKPINAFLNIYYCQLTKYLVEYFVFSIITFMAGLPYCIPNIFIFYVVGLNAVNNAALSEDLNQFPNF